MRNVTLALLYGAYVFLGLTVGALVWRSGAGLGSGVSAALGTIGLALAIHSMVTAALATGALRHEVGQIRHAHRLLADAIEETRASISELSTTEADQVRRSDELTGEVRMLEDLVSRMGETLQARAELWRIGAVTQEKTREQDTRASLLETVREALSANRVDLYLQPVVSLPQRKTVFYESFSRLRDETGRVLMPAEYLAVAEPEGLVAAIDNLLLFRCVQIVRKLAKQDRKIGIFCNVSLASLGDESFFPNFLEFLADNRDLGGALIFELGQGAFEARGSVEARNMAKLAELGFRFSIDKVTDLELDFRDLNRAEVKFVKIAADVMLNRLLDHDGRLALKSLRDIHAGDFTALTRRYGIEVIAEKVEAERQVIDILELQVPYGQGHLFGEPRAIREAVLAETKPPADFMRPALRRVAGAR